MSSKRSQYMAALRGDYRVALRLYLLNKDETIREEITSDLIVGGNLHCTMQNGMRRTATITINNEDLRYSPNPNRLWFGQKFKLFGGVVLDDGSEYLIPQGVFYSSNPGSSYLQSNRLATINLVDKWAYVDGSLFGKVRGAYYIPKTVPMGATTVNVKLADAVRSTLQQNDGTGAPIDPIAPFFDTNITNIDLPYTLRSSATGTYADVLLELNKMMIASMGYDQNGRLCVTSDNTNVDHSGQSLVWRFDEDSSQLFTLDSVSQMSEVYNHIYVVGATLDGQIFKGEAACTSAKFDTNIQRAGDKVNVIEDSTLYSSTYAQERAEYELRKSQRLGHQFNGSSAPQFHWYPGCLISVPPMDASRRAQTIMITDYNIPLASTGAMTWTGTTLI